MANTMRDKIKSTLDTTPTAVRWLLMVAAFVVVLILLVLLGGRTRIRRRLWIRGMISH